ncbi:MAG: flagellar export chaperone FliS [Candidatus Neomarinimicrobiota bacterium]
MYPQTMAQNRNNINPYVMQRVLTASPEQLISYVYDVAISSCANEDRYKATKAVQELINALNFDYKEQSLTFFRIYRYILNNIHKGNFSEAQKLLTDIKRAWVQAMQVE